MNEPVRCSVRDGVAELCLNRPAKRNALDDAMFVALVQATDQLASDPSVRAVVLRGEGTAFCAGLDFSSFRAFADEADAGARPFGDPDAPSSGRRAPGTGRRIVANLRRVPAPVIAAVHGPAIGGGLQLALGADIRFVGPEARLAAREIEFGITPDMGGTQLLPRLVGSDRALELILTGRTVGPEEAVRIGLATAAHDDPVAAAFELATAIATRNPEVVVGSKGLIRLSERCSVEEGMDAELRMLAWNMGRPNQRAAVRARLDGGTAAFADVDPAAPPPPVTEAWPSADRRSQVRG